MTENTPTTEKVLALFAEAWRPLDPQVAFVLSVIYSRAIAQGIKPLNEMTPVEARRVTALMQFYLGAGAPAIPHIEERTIDAASGKIRVRLYDPGTAAPAPAVVFLHGGGWVLCDIDIYDGVARQLAKRSGMRVVSVDYARAPEHPFPIPLDDCAAAVRWVLGNGAEFGIDPARVAIAGDFVGRQSRVGDLPEATPAWSHTIARRRADLRLLLPQHRHAHKPRLWRRRVSDLEARDGMVLAELRADRRRAPRSACRAAAGRSHGPAAALSDRQRVRRPARRFRTARRTREGCRRRD